MSFDRKKFSPAHVNAGPWAPRIFTYFNDKGRLSEIMEPGYFQKQHLIMRANSFVKVICKDAIVELVVDNNINQMVTMKNEFLRFTDPYIENKKSLRVRRTAAQIQADEKKAKLAKTG